NPKTEIRNPKAEPDSCASHCSDFGIQNSFGFQHSDFGFPLWPSSSVARSAPITNGQKRLPFPRPTLAQPTLSLRTLAPQTFGKSPNHRPSSPKATGGK